jgi:[acyl-carrier-protein] S-malonyltransferase
MDKIAFLFPGQGAQYPKMGKDFFDNFAIAKRIFQNANDALKFDLTKVIFEGTEDILKKTEYSQVAIFVVSCVIKEVVQAEFGLKPTLLAGLSLGEYSALYASEAIKFEDSLSLIQKRALFMSEACLKNDGQMTAILGLPVEEIEKVLKNLNPPHLIWIANYNTSDQTVISGSAKDMDLVIEALKEKGAKKAVKLQVQGAFHTPMMMEAQKRLSLEIDKTNFLKNPNNIIMNYSADYSKDISQLKKNLTNQVTSSVRWKQTIEKMNTENIELYLELGPLKTLTMMNKKNNLSGLSLNVDNIADLEKLSSVLKG